MTKNKIVLSNIDPHIVPNAVEPVKGKRGRKSKKELMAALNMSSFSAVGTTQSTLGSNENVVLNVTENFSNNENDTNSSNIVIITNPNSESSIDHILSDTDINADTKQVIKKRGRKPKGGKIVQQIIHTENKINDKPNVILHLKCSIKDLQMANLNNIESYTFNSKNNLNYDLIGEENISSVNTYCNKPNDSITNNNFKNNDYEYINEQYPQNKDGNKEIWRKLKQLEHNLHINNVNNKKSACFWDSCDFDNPPVYIPKHYINGTYHVYGCFCSPECGVAYLMNENIDSSTKFERYHLFNHIYSKIYDYKKNIKPSPNPHYMLEKFYGNLSIQEYRSLLRNERLFIIVDKPLTRILPELHDDNDEFILNNKIIPSNNNYQLKSRMNKKKTNKNLILNENFGISNSIEE